MNLYSILVVDDEQEIIDAMVKRVNWNEMGFTIAGSAGNGVEALEIAASVNPDVVFTDIKMPYMDGLQLASKLREQYPNIKIVIGSGFDEFDFAREAMALGVYEYLLKPINTEDLKRVFTKLHDLIDDEREKRNSVQYLEKYYEKSLTTIRENFLSMLVEGSLTENFSENFLKEFGIEFNSINGPFVVGVIHVSRSEDSEVSSRLRSVSVRKMAEEWEEKHRGHYVFAYRENFCIVADLSTLSFDDFYSECDRFCKVAGHELNAVITIGIGRVVNSLGELSASYKGGREAVSYRVLYGTGMPINISEIEPKETFQNIGEDELMQNIFKQIKLGNEDDLNSAIDRYITTIIGAHININRFRMILMDLLSGFYKFCMNNSIDASEMGFGDADLYQELLKMESSEELEKWMKSVSLKLREDVVSQRSSKNKSIVERAKDFVKDNYSNPDLTIDMVCEKLNVSAAYFSTVFRKETGKTFINYLTEYRMDEAIRLLIEEDEKTYIIAEKVGYSDANYFSYVFKKQFGMSPTVYKRQRKA